VKSTDSTDRSTCWIC